MHIINNTGIYIHLNTVHRKLPVDAHIYRVVKCVGAWTELTRADSCLEASLVTVDSFVYYYQIVVE